MKNCISRRSFLKAAGMLGAAGALAACGGSSSSLQRSQLCCRFRHRQLRCKHQAVDLPHRRLGQG